MKKYEVKVLKKGYSHRTGSGEMRADGTITLVKGAKRLLVDTGAPRDKDFIIDALASYGLRPGDITHVVCTHGHGDHVGNNNLFPDATFIVGHDICVGDLYAFHDFKSGAPYIVDDNVEVMATPGHTGQDISVIVKTEEGVVAIVGDLFESEADLEDDKLWKASSELPAEQEKSRAKVLSTADFIVPGHGDRFKVRKG